MKVSYKGIFVFEEIFIFIFYVVFCVLIFFFGLKGVNLKIKF